MEPVFHAAAVCRGCHNPDGYDGARRRDGGAAQMARVLEGGGALITISHDLVLAERLGAGSW